MIYALYNQYNTVDNIQYYRCDVSNQAEVERVAKQVIDEVGKFCYICFLYCLVLMIVTFGTPYDPCQ